MTQSVMIPLAGVSAGWDTLQLGISASGIGGGTNDIYAGAEVALASATGSFPVITRLNYGDPYPSSPVFGSGSEVLWGFGFGLGDGDFYTASEFGTFGGGPALLGWVHLSVENSSSIAKITVIDWAYSDVAGETVAMGQIPEPATLLMVASALAIGFLLRFVQHRSGKF